MGVIAKGIPRGCQGFFIPVSMGYPLSVFNKRLYSQTNKYYYLSRIVFVHNQGVLLFFYQDIHA